MNFELKIKLKNGAICNCMLEWKKKRTKRQHEVIEKNMHKFMCTFKTKQPKKHKN